MRTQSASRKERLMITHLEMENFLSFPGCQKIGPFHKKFTIRELNDGGKVNVIDALHFVFGKRAKQEDLNRTSELIHRSARYPNLEYCRVSVHFQLIIDDESSEEMYEVLTDSSFVISRVTYQNNHAEYLVDNRSSRLSNLGLVFMQHGVDLVSNRFTFLHGDLINVSVLKPKSIHLQEVALLDFIEEIFGSSALQDELGMPAEAAATVTTPSRGSTPYNQISESNNALVVHQPEGFIHKPYSAGASYPPAPQQTSSQQLQFDSPRQGESGIQRLADKIINEFQQNCEHLQLNALDGNGDSFQVYQGAIRSLTTFQLASVLRHPSCFYFFTASAIPTIPLPDLEDSVMQRDICWLTDPAPPLVQSRSHNTISASWPFVSFCGITPPAYIDSVQYVLEIAQGVEYKPGYFTRFISDVCAVDYRTVCHGANINSTTIHGLLPARWYHLRLSIEYLGQRFVSESQSIHTPTWVPSAPVLPRATLLPVLSSFDLQNDSPVRLEVMLSWNPSIPNGQDVTTYQCHIQKFNQQGYVVQSSEALLKKEKHHRHRVFYQSPDRDPNANQWTQSPGRSALQVHNSIVLGNRSPTRGRTSQQNSRISSHSPGRFPELNESSSSILLRPPSPTSPEERRFKWEIVYDNILTNVKCASPESDHAEWHIRVRSRNSNGWSDFSPILKMNGLTHPTLFSLPPPVHAYGTCYYTEHASAQYLDGTELEQYRQAPAKERPVAEFIPEVSDSIKIRNGLVMHRGAAPQDRTPKERKRKTRRPQSLDMETRQKQLVDSLNSSNNNINAGSSSGKSTHGGGGGSSKESGKLQPPQQQPAKLHVLHFKERNNWDSGTGTSLNNDSSEKVVQLADKQDPSARNLFNNINQSQKKSESLPSLSNVSMKASRGSQRTLFNKNS